MKIFIWIASFFIIVGIPDTLLIEFYDIKFGAIPTILLVGVAYLTAKTLCKKWDIHKASRENADMQEETIQTARTSSASETPPCEISTVKVSAVAKRKKTVKPEKTETSIIPADNTSELNSEKNANKKKVINKFTAAIVILCILLTTSVAINAHMAYSNSILQEKIETLNQTVEKKTALLNTANSKYIDLKSEHTDTKIALRFYEKYAVIIPDDNTNTYHTYGCEYCSNTSFYIFSINEAKSKGFSPCKYCRLIYEHLYERENK